MLPCITQFETVASTEQIVVELLARSDPPNLALLAVVWWRLDRRLRRLSETVEEVRG